MKKRWISLIGCMLAILAGCATQSDEELPDWTPVPGQAGEGAQRPTVQFPDYFLIDGYVLHDHGHIPNTRLIGAGLSANLDLTTVRKQFNDQLFAHGWNTDKVEMGKQSFRIIASHKEGDTVEIRAVQGSSGPTQVFLLYTPIPN